MLQWSKKVRNGVSSVVLPFAAVVDVGWSILSLTVRAIFWLFSSFGLF